MTTGQTITIHNTIYDCSTAVTYHYGGFPPHDIDINQVFESLIAALQQITRYDEKLKNIPNSELLLAPLRQRDAVVSSRMEGTISTLEEVLRIEANKQANSSEHARDDAIEVALYARALKNAEQQMFDGYPLSEHLIRNAHSVLLSWGRGAEKSPGRYKSKQNYIGDRHQKCVDFIPISPEQLGVGMRQLIKYIQDNQQHALIKTAVAHAEFEALHPFEYGNGRLGRMLIPLMLWDQGLISAPHFFVSDYFETNKETYLELLRKVSAKHDWATWCCFFFDGLEAQAKANIDLVQKIQKLYETMSEKFRDTLRSQYFNAALDYMFSNPIFWNNHFLEHADAPKSTLRNFTPRLVEAGILRIMIPPAGRAAGLYAFVPLLDTLQETT